MTDRILSEDDVNSVAWSAEVGDHIIGGVKIVALCASHRLQAARIQELEKTVGWYEEKHPDD